MAVNKKMQWKAVEGRGKVVTKDDKRCSGRQSKDKER